MKVGSAAVPGQTLRTPETQIDRVFAKWVTTTPGCAIGVAINGQATLAKATNPEAAD